VGKRLVRSKGTAFEQGSTRKNYFLGEARYRILIADQQRGGRIDQTKNKGGIFRKSREEEDVSR